VALHEVAEHECVGCYKLFPGRPNKIRCKPSCGRKQPGDRHKNKKRPGGRYKRIVTHFIAIDGEGVTVNGEHHYVLLSVGDKSLHKNGAHLDYESIWAFLWDQFLEDTTATYVGFFLGYDFAQWLRTLPEERARMLLSAQGIASRRRQRSNSNPTPFPVRFNGWEFDMLPHRRFKLRPENSKEPWLYICDAGSFFQTSFLTAIDPEHWTTPLLSTEEMAIIVEGKQRRQVAAFDDTMIQYNVTENVVMSRLMGELHKGLTSIGVSLKRSQYFGPGQAASEWLQQTASIDALEVIAHVPKPVREAAIASYYGGWFEIRRHGHVKGPSWQYDINSAYPHIIAQLPCLKHGYWTQSGTNTKYVLMHVVLKSLATTFGPAPYRTPEGRIMRPMSVQGWYWKHEIEAAYEAGLLHDHALIQSWSLVSSCNCEPPLKDVAKLYEIRRQMGKDTAIGRAAKLVYNSVYGKFAQSAGQPRWANPIYASLITSGCRTMILKALATHPLGASACSMIATDSVLFSAAHPSLAVSDQLGDWSVKESDNLMLFAPGIYWDDKARARIREGKSLSLKSRGVAGSDIASMIEQVDWAFNLWEPKQPWPTVKVPIQFNMITCEQALAWGKWNVAGIVRDNTHRELSSDPHDKRASIFRDDLGWYSIPYPHWVPLESAPYARRFGEGLEARAAEAAEGPDGPVDALFAEALGLS
jgi:DNA polymerase type B, organellar and viral